MSQSLVNVNPSLKISALVLLVGLLWAPLSRAEEASAAWLQVVRATPYASTAGLYRNLATIRRWVLLGKGYCAEPDRHILFDRRGTFLAWFDNPGDAVANQRHLNAVRAALYRKHRVRQWVAGATDETGYPFALSCDQPHVDIARAVQRLLGTDPADRVWGTWDGMKVGSRKSPVPLIELVLQVLRDQARKLGFHVSGEMARAILGQIIIESGVRKRSFSDAQAVGLLQLRPEVLDDCDLAKRFRLHRMAQVECVVRLYREIDRNLRPAFDARFGVLPADKREALYPLLLVQTYQIGIGRMQQLLGDGEPGIAARRLAADQERFSARDLALGIIFHNMGRIGLGLSSLYYLVDVGIAGDAACRATPLCDSEAAAG